MPRKRKDNLKNNDKDRSNEEETEEKLKHARNKVSRLNAIQKKMEFGVYVTSITLLVILWSTILYGIYSIMPIQRTPVDLPQIDMNQYWGAYPMNPEQDLSIRPYKVEFSDVIINDLRERLLHQRPFHPPLEYSGFAYGFNTNFLVKLLDFWKNKYDFKERERFFNKYNHYITNIQGLDIHYMHVKPTVTSDVKMFTLLLLHSSPSSIREFYDIIPILTKPNAKYKFVFEVIVPSLPGFGFSQGPVRPGMGQANMAVVIKNLMERIGRTSYYVHGGDVGHTVGSALATVFPNNVLGFHTTAPRVYHPLLIIRTIMAFIVPSFMTEPEIPKESISVYSFLERAIEETGYKRNTHTTQPDTLSIALTDSPAGLAAYIIEKDAMLTFRVHQNAEDGNIRNKFSVTQLLDNVMVYWTANSITSAIRVQAELQKHFNYDWVETDVPTWGLKLNHLEISAHSVLKRKYKNYLHTTIIEGEVAEYSEFLADDIFAAVDTFVAFNAENGKAQETIEEPVKKPLTVYDFTITDIHGKDVKLEKYKGFVLLIVNVASECGLTDRNYQELVKLHDEYEDKGLRILAFPCNQFGSQEPGSPQDIRLFTNMRGVKFDVFSKVEVNGVNAHPLWKFLKETQSGTFGDWIKWNFSKFIVDRDGVPVERFGPDVNPFDLEPFLVKYLKLNDETNNKDNT